MNSKLYSVADTISDGRSDTQSYPQVLSYSFVTS